MPTSFLHLPLELRDEIYKLIFPFQRATRGEPLQIETDTKLWEDYPVPDPFSVNSNLYPQPPPKVSDQLLRSAARLLRTCHQLNIELAPYVYGQQQFMFYRPWQAMTWLDSIGDYQTHLRHIAISGCFLPNQASDDEQVQARMWASVIRKFPNATSLSCFRNLHNWRWQAPNWSNTVWGNEVVLEAIRDLAHVRIMVIEGVLMNQNGFFGSSLELTLEKPLLETLVLTGCPIAGGKWYPEYYFDRLTALKHLTIRHGHGIQSGKTKVSNEFFSHIAPLRSCTWHGYCFPPLHRKAFTARHSGTIQFLDLNVFIKHSIDRFVQESEEAAWLDSLVQLFEALPVLKVLDLCYCYQGIDVLLQHMPPTLQVLSLRGGVRSGRFSCRDKSLGSALKTLPDQCPQLAHVLLSIDQAADDEDQAGRCMRLSNQTRTYVL